MLGNNLGGSSPWGQIGQGAASLFGNLFMPNPGDKANDYYEKALQQLPQYFQPWMQSGQQALPDWLKQAQQLTQNPGGFINNIGQNFQQSPGLQFQIQQGTQAANNAASAGGMAGSPQAQQYSAGIANNLANQDYYNYLSNALNQYGLGFKGLGDISGQGQHSAQALGEDTSNILNNQAQLQYAAQNNQNQGFGSGLGQLFGGALALFGL